MSKVKKVTHTVNISIAEPTAPVQILAPPMPVVQSIIQEPIKDTIESLSNISKGENMSYVASVLTKYDPRVLRGSTFKFKAMWLGRVVVTGAVLYGIYKIARNYKRIYAAAREVYDNYKAKEEKHPVRLNITVRAPAELRLYMDHAANAPCPEPLSGRAEGASGGKLAQAARASSASSESIAQTLAKGGTAADIEKLPAASDVSNTWWSWGFGAQPRTQQHS